MLPVTLPASSDASRLKKEKINSFAATRDAFSYGFCFCNQTIGTGQLEMGVLMKLFQAPASGA